MVSGQKVTQLAGIALLLAALTCCSARKTYPDPSPGWHSGDFSVLSRPPPACSFAHSRYAPDLDPEIRHRQRHLSR